MAEIYAACIEMGVSPEYFSTKMNTVELDAIMSYHNRSAWEMTRFLGLLLAQANSTKSINAQDILKFLWDETGNESTASVGCSIEEANEMIYKSNQIANIL